MEYAIVSAQNIDQLVTLVQVRLNDGWKPQGGPFLDFDMRRWCQAVTRPKNGCHPPEIRLREPRKRV